MKYIGIKILILLMIISGWLNFTCDAPRYNPLDPENPDNKLASISGQVETFSIPHLPIENVDVYWKDGNQLIQTDLTGYFQIINIVPIDGWIHFSKSGYLDDSVYIEWEQNLNQNLNIEFNKRPYLDSLLIYSIIQNRYPNIQVLTLGIEALISDPDNDIDSVYVQNPDLNFNDFLLYNVNKQMYQRTFSMSDLGIVTAEAVIGHEFQIIVKDKLSNRIQLDKMSVKRIIKEQINLISPGSHDVVSSLPTLSWEPLTPGYFLKYNIEIYNTDDVEARLIWQKQGIAQNTSSVQVDQELFASENYFWVIWCIDEFNNRSRSRPKSFEVE